MLVKRSLAAVVVAVAVLAGCMGEPKNGPAPLGDALVVRIPEGVYDPANKGPYYLLPEVRFDGPATIRWVNDDVVYHRMIAQAVPFDGVPGWVALATHRHDSSGSGTHTHTDAAAHDHGGDPSIIFDVSVEAGQTLDMPLDFTGILAIHCHPHPWMVDEWIVARSEVSPYDVSVGRVSLAGETNGTSELAHGSVADVLMRLQGPNLLRINASLTWDDSLDDGPAGEATNGPDRFLLSFHGPAGERVAEARQTARQGAIWLDFQPPAYPWPTTVLAKGLTDASDRLREARPDDVTFLGKWTIRITLEDAPGPVPGQDLHDTGIEGVDGVQDWSLAVTVEQEWGQPATAGAAASPFVQGALELGSDSVPHTH